MACVGASWWNRTAQCNYYPFFSKNKDSNDVCPSDIANWIPTFRQSDTRINKHDFGQSRNNNSEKVVAKSIALSRQTFCTYRVNTGNWEGVNPPGKQKNTYLSVQLHGKTTLKRGRKTQTDPERDIYFPTMGSRVRNKYKER